MLRLSPEEQIAKRKMWFRKALELQSVSQACAWCGISRKGYYKWWNRFRDSGFDPRVLADRSKRPKRLRKPVKKKIVRRIIKIRQRTGLGPERIRDQLLRQGLRRVPSIRTIARLLKRHGLAKAWKHPHKKPLRKHRVELPGELVQVDVKYVPYRIHHRQYFQYTAIDCATRLRVLRFYEELSAANSRDFLDAVVRAFPFKIQVVQTDNGVEFTYLYVTVDSDFRKEPRRHPVDGFCQDRGMGHRLIPPGQPKFNGYVERSHRIDMEEFYRWKKCRSLIELKTEGRKWQDRYNRRRPHGGIGKLTPLLKLNAYPAFRFIRKLAA